MRMHVRALLLIIAALALAAGGCRDTSGTGPGGNGNGSGPDGGAGGDGGDVSGEMSIQELQTDAVAVGAPVTLREVVVVAVDTYGGRRGSVYVMEPEGGPHSGVLVFLTGTQAANLAPGDLIDVEGGVKEEFAFDADDSGRSLTQIVQPFGGEVVLTKVGEGEVPEPELVDPAVLAADDDEAAKWESVLVRIEEVAVESGPRQIGGDETFQEIRVTGPMLVVSELAPLAPDGEEPEVGNCYASITGILTYAFDYQMLPRETDDLVRDDDACPPLEDVVSVREIQQSDEIEEGDAVSVVEAVVTAVKLSEEGEPEHFFIQDQVQEPEQHNGIYVFRGDEPEPLPDGFGVGSLVNVRGEVGAFRNATQIVPPAEGSVQVTVVDGTEDPVVYVDPPLAEVASVADGEPYESVLVEFSNLEVVEGVNQFGEFRVSDGDTQLIVDDFLHAHEPNVEDCLATLRGVMTENDFGDGNRPLLPRSEDDVVPGGDCSE